MHENPDRLDRLNTAIQIIRQLRHEAESEEFEGGGLIDDLAQCEARLKRQRGSSFFDVEEE